VHTSFVWQSRLSIKNFFTWRFLCQRAFSSNVCEPGLHDTDRNKVNHQQELEW